MPVISVRVSDEWLAMVDAEAGLRKWSRNAAIVNILWQALGGENGFSGVRKESGGVSPDFSNGSGDSA